MKNFKNCLNGVEINEKCFSFLKEELNEGYSLNLLLDLLSLPCMKHETRHKLLLILALLEDQQTDDKIIDILVQVLNDITGELWQNNREKLEGIMLENYYKFSRSSMLLLAHTFELMHAKGYSKAFDMAHLLYQRISLNDYEFNPDSEENVRVKLAKIAYSTSGYNFNEKMTAIEEIKCHLKKSGRKHLMGIVNYYKGLCLDAANCKIDYEGAQHFILKSKNKGFELATVYLNHRQNNFETSKKG